MNIPFFFAMAVALIGLVVAGRFLYLAWSDYHFGRERRKQRDRRNTTMLVPIERRKGERRD